MNKELIELYIQAFKEGIFRKDNSGRVAPAYWGGTLPKAILAKEDEVFGPDHKDSEINWMRRETSEYEEAAKQWRKIVMSKLYRSLK